jgi:CheY-like chemotaxis protein
LKSILVLEDSPDDAFLLSRAMRYACLDASIEFVRSVPQGIAWLEACHKPNLPHLILVDLTMPGLGGFEFIHWLRKERRFAHIPALILTNKVSLDGPAEAKRLGAQGYLMKPATQDALYALVKQLQRDWLSPNQ